MKILLDENLPVELAALIAGHEVSTVLKQNWLGLKNGVLLQLAETEFEVFITADQKLKYQQNLAKRKIAIIVLPTNNISQLGALLAELLTILPTIKSGDYVSLNFK